MRFIRYTAYPSWEKDGTFWNSNGVLSAARLVLEAQGRRIPKREKKIVRDIFKWFNESPLKVPPFSAKKKRNEWSKEAVSWFRTSQIHLFHKKVMLLVYFLRYYGMVVSIKRVNYPGKIVYRDKHQIVAETPKKHLPKPLTAAEK